MKRTFEIKAYWDDDVKRWYSDSDIIGLHIEAATLDEFEDVMRDVAVELILANHVSSEMLATRPLRDIVPAILWQRPEAAALSA